MTCYRDSFTFTYFPLLNVTALSPIGSLGCVGEPMGTGKFFLHSYRCLRTSQRERICCLAIPTCFLHNPKFYKADCSSRYLSQAGFLLGIFFDSEDGEDIFLWNVGFLPTDYIALYPRTQNSSKPSLWEPKILQNVCGSGVGYEHLNDLWNINYPSECSGKRSYAES
jgi:hypothetical protein